MVRYFASEPPSEREQLGELCGDYLIGATQSEGKVLGVRLRDDAPREMIEEIEQLLGRPFRGQKAPPLENQRLRALEQKMKEIDDSFKEGKLREE